MQTCQTPPKPASSTATVLVVEDNDAVRNLLDALLRSMGYHVLIASGPYEALEIAADEDASIDLVMTDVMMPQMRGPELAERIEILQPDVRVLLLSGHSRETALNHGCARHLPFIQKPFRHESLAQKLREVLDA